MLEKTAPSLRSDAGKKCRGASVSLAGAVLLFGVLLCTLAAPAGAARVHNLLSEEVLSGETQPLTTPVGVAVNQTTNHIYVVASLGANAEGRALFNLDSDGKPDALLYELPGAEALYPNHVAVDSSGGSYDGYIYASSVKGGIQQYDPSGSETAVRITVAAVPPNGTAQAGGLPPVANGEFKNAYSGKFETIFAPQAVAVGPSGNVFTYEQENGAIDEFTPEGTFVKQFDQGSYQTGVSADGIAVGASGDVYVAGNNTVEAGLYEFSPSGECVPADCSPLHTLGLATGVAVDRATGDVLVTGSSEEEQPEFSEFDSAGDLLGTTALPPRTERTAIAVDESSGNVIVAVKVYALGESSVQIYGPVEVVPDVETEAASDVTDSAAVLNGKVGAAEVPFATCVFQYVDAEEFAAGRFAGAAEAPCEPAGPFSGLAMNEVHASIGGLRGGTTYHYRIVGSNENGSNPGGDLPFQTLGPSVTGVEASDVSETGARLSGIVDPNGEPATYRFQYVSEEAFEASGFAGAVDVPATPEGVSSSGSAVPVVQEVHGLASGTAYRFRVVAESTVGVTEGVAEGFSTFRVAPEGLPDGRGYEQVSPVEKGGADIEGEIDGVQASADGSRVTFAAFAGLPLGEGEQNLASYMASRGAGDSGWSTRGMFPPASYGSSANILGWDEDLANVYDYASAHLGSTTLLDLSSADGSISEVGHVEGRGYGNPYFFAGASADGEVALLESEDGGLLAGDLSGEQNVYVYDHGTGSLVVAGVMNDGVVPSGGVAAGPYDYLGLLANSHLYYTEAEHAISADGGRVFFTAEGTGQLYVRENPFAQQSAMSGEECTEAATKACTVRVSAPEAGVGDPGTPAAFIGASEDGSVAYFLDKGKLTAGSTAGAGYDLYRYDLQSGKLTDLTVDAVDRNGAEVRGVLGVSAEGNDAYFVAAGVLAQGASKAPSGETNLYALHGEEVVFITRLSTASEEDKNDWLPSAAPTTNGCCKAHASRVSADGQTLLFTSARDLTAYRSHDTPELYLYRTGRGILCVSCNPTGEAPTGRPAGLQNIKPLGAGPTRDLAIMTRNLSANGRRVIFDSSDRLVAADENDVNDVYEWEEKGEGSCESEAEDGGCLFLISSGKSPDPSFFGDADLTGENVFFFTLQPLVVQDKDQLVDVYDARVGGGLPSQSEAVRPPSCEALEACRVPLSEPPAEFSAASMAIFGAGNLVAAPQLLAVEKLVKKHAKRLTRKQRLAGALRVCRKHRPRSRRLSCEKRARKRYGAKPKPRAKIRRKPRARVKRMGGK
ncbi:MAG: hypothetical protein ACRDK7_12980 [Solirubrobacteraceae bacterium]